MKIALSILSLLLFFHTKAANGSDTPDAAAKNTSLITPSCVEPLEVLTSKHKDLYAKAKKEMTGKLDGLNECQEKIQKHIEACSSESTNSPLCQGDTSPRIASSQNISNMSDDLTRMLIQNANCLWSVSSCYVSGNMAKQRVSIQNWSFCTKEADADNEADKKTINNYYYDYNNSIERTQSQCFKQAADSYERQARENLAKSAATKTPEEFAQQAIDCITHDNGNKVCVFRTSGGSHFEKVSYLEGSCNEQSDKRSCTENVKNNSPARLDGCSGTLLGDGESIVTAGHCTKNATSQMVEVFDKDNRKMHIQANCAVGIDEEVRGTDVSVCKLTQPIKANPTYLATYDANVSGSGCETTGYIMKCGEGFFQNLTQHPVSMMAYPTQYDRETGSTTKDLYWTKGVLLWDKETKNLQTDMLCTGGCSGGGYTINYEGRNVVVGAHGYTNRYVAGYGGAAVIPNNSFNSLKVQSISDDKLAYGKILFEEMPTSK